MTKMTEHTASRGAAAQPSGAPILGPRNVPVERENPDHLVPPATDSGTIPNLKFSFSAAHNRLLTGGWARGVTTRDLPIATDLAGVNMRLKPGAIREMHWHKEGEWAYMIAGSARITAVDADGRNFMDDVGVGDLWYFPAGIPHSIQGLEFGCEFLLVFDDGSFSENEAGGALIGAGAGLVFKGTTGIVLEAAAPEERVAMTSTLIIKPTPYSVSVPPSRSA